MNYVGHFIPYLEALGKRGSGLSIGSIRLFLEGLFTVMSDQSSDKMRSDRYQAGKWWLMSPPMQRTWESKFTDMNAQNYGCKELRGGESGLVEFHSS